MGIKEGIDKVKNVVDNASETMDQINNVVNTVKNPQKAATAAKNTRDTKDADRIYKYIDEREDEINEAMKSGDLTMEDKQALTDYLERLEELREKTKNRVHKRLMEDREFEHKVTKDMADIQIRQHEADTKRIEAQASMVKAKNENTKALAIFGGNLIGNVLGAAVMHEGITTGAAVELIQGGSITSTTGKNQLPKFSDVARTICETRNL